MKKVSDLVGLLWRMALAGLITYIVFIGPFVLLRAVINDMSEKMTLFRSALDLFTMFALQLLYCFLLVLFRYNSTGEGISRLTEDCKTEPYAGLWKDMQKLVHKEQAVLLIGLILITLCTFQIFIPVGMEVTTFFVGITGVTIYVPQFLIFLLATDPAAPNMGVLMLSCVVGMLVGLASFSGMYLCLVSLKRKKWYKEWKV